MSLNELWQKIELEFAVLLGLSDSIFMESEIREVQEYVDANEFGLALATYRGIVDEEGRETTEEINKRIIKISAMMYS